MKYCKFLFLLILVFASIFILTGCGAKVNSTVSVDEKGSGYCEILLNIAKSDATYIEGGIPKLISVIEGAKPISDMDITQEPGDTEYFRIKLSYRFENIEDYNKKTSIIIGEKHNAVFESSKGIFGERYRFSEPNISEKRIKWAVDAVKKSGIVNDQGYSIYEINQIKYIIPKAEKVFNQHSEVDVRYENVVPVRKIEIASDFEPDKPVARTIIISFAVNDYKKLNTAAVKKHLSQFGLDIADQFEENGCYHYKFVLNAQTNEEIEEAMKKISGTEAVFKLTKDPDSIVLHDINSLQENFDLQKLIEGTTSLGGVEIKWNYPAGYNIKMKSGGLDVNVLGDTSSAIIVKALKASLSYSIEKSVYSEEVKVVSSFDGNKLNKEISYVFNKESFKYITEQEIDDYFKSVNKGIKKLDDGKRKIYIENISIKPGKKGLKKNQENGFIDRRAGAFSSKALSFVTDSFSFGSRLGNLVPINGIKYSFSSKGEILRLSSSDKNNMVSDVKKGKIYDFSFDSLDGEVNAIVESSVIPPAVWMILIALLAVLSVTVFAIKKRDKTKISVVFEEKEFKKEEYVSV